MIMLCDEEENCDLFVDEDDKLLTDEDILLLMLEDCSRKSDPTHLQYPQFDIRTLSDKEFVTQFRFKRPDIGPLMQALRLQNEYIGGNGIKWSGKKAFACCCEGFVTQIDFLILYLYLVGIAQNCH